MAPLVQTVIHEYVHTLEHPEHRTYRGALGQEQGGFTLREGTTDYFAKIAYNNTNRDDPTLHENVEWPRPRRRRGELWQPELTP